MEPICSVLEKHYVATGALAAAALQASRRPAPWATFCLQLSPISGVVTYLPFCIYNKLDRKISQMHPIIKKAAVRAGGPLGPAGSDLRLCRSERGRLVVLTMLNVWLRNYFIQALLPVGVVVQNKASYPVIVCACTMVLPLINNHQ